MALAYFDFVDKTIAELDTKRGRVADLEAQYKSLQESMEEGRGLYKKYKDKSPIEASEIIHHMKPVFDELKRVRAELEATAVEVTSQRDGLWQQLKGLEQQVEKAKADHVPF